jgi:hypothetical protein
MRSRDVGYDCRQLRHLSVLGVDEWNIELLSLSRDNHVDDMNDQVLLLTRDTSFEGLVAHAGVRRFSLEDVQRKDRI